MEGKTKAMLNKEKMIHMTAEVKSPISLLAIIKGIS
jgi:hypothetical protein